MTEYLSLTELQHEDDVSVPALLAYAKRRSDRLPLWIKPAGDGWAAKLISRVLTSESGEPELWSHSDAEVWVTAPLRVRPETLRGEDGEVVFQRFRHDGRHPDYGGDVREFLEFPEPRSFGAMDLLVRRTDLERWKALTAARLAANDQAERLREQIRVVVERAEFSWSTVQAATALGGAQTTLFDHRKKAAELELPMVWRNIKPNSKRPTYRWVDDAESLRNWSALLALSTGGEQPQRRRRNRGGSRGRGGSQNTELGGDELERLLGLEAGNLPTEEDLTLIEEAMQQQDLQELFDSIGTDSK